MGNSTLVKGLPFFIQIVLNQHQQVPPPLFNFHLLLQTPKPGTDETGSTNTPYTYGFPRLVCYFQLHIANFCRHFSVKDRRDVRNKGVVKVQNIEYRLIASWLSACTCACCCLFKRELASAIARVKTFFRLYTLQREVSEILLKCCI